MFEQQQSQTDPTSPAPPSPDQFRELCAGLEEYEHLPELIPAAAPAAAPLSDQSHEEALDASILAGLTLP